MVMFWLFLLTFLDKLVFRTILIFGPVLRRRRFALSRPVSCLQGRGAASGRRASSGRKYRPTPVRQFGGSAVSADVPFKSFYHT